MNIVITGGAGFIGSHMVALLSNLNHQITVIDNFSNSSPNALKRLSHVAKDFSFHLADLNNIEEIKYAFSQIIKSKGPIDAVYHFAGLKAVGESNDMPLRYHQNNVSGSLNLFQVMEENEIYSLIFSSSATVYGSPERIPVDEKCKTQVTNPYGRSKLVIEDMLKDISKANDKWRIAILRYFNPIGAHPSGLIGEEPQGVPNNIMPYLCQVAIGQRDFLISLAVVMIPEMALELGIIFLFQILVEAVFFYHLTLPTVFFL